MTTEEEIELWLKVAKRETAEARRIRARHDAAVVGREEKLFRAEKALERLEELFASLMASKKRRAA